jgi:predicted phosphoribosyltransferase
MFLNREEAGLRLALLLSQEKKREDSVVVAIPRGGVIVGNVVSEVLGLPLETLLVKKIGAPNNPELAIGATGTPLVDSVVFWDEDLVSRLKVSDKEKNELLAVSQKTIRERERNLNVKIPGVKNKFAIVVDDGVATGATVIVASLVLKKLGSKTGTCGVF